MGHAIRVTIDERDGLMANLVCVDHDEAQCGPREVFYWDAVNSMEQYNGQPIEFPDVQIDVIAVSEDEGFVWQTHPLIACPHWSPGTITMRRGCTACAANHQNGSTT